MAHDHHEERALRFALITCSDTRSMAEDTAGDALAEIIAAKGWDLVDRVIVKDDRQTIAEAIKHACDDIDPAVDIVLTCGGTGLSLRDVTPEATRDVCEREVPGIAEGMRAYSMQKTPFAMLSRALCMQRGRVIVINLPGSKKAATENWEALEPVMAHAVSMMAGDGHE